MSEPACWATLPAEIHNEILQLVEDDPDTPTHIMNYILVCKTWQSWFEYSNYQNLVINSSRLSDLDRLVGKNPLRRSSVKKITLRVHFKHHQQFDGESDHDYDKRLSKRGVDLTTFVVRLLEILKDWTKGPHEQGLTLEILTYLPKDWTYESLFHIITGLKINLDPKKPLPEVPIITSLILRGQYHYCFEFPTLASIVKQSLKNLTGFHIEGSHHFLPPQLHDFDQDITELVKAFPRTLKSWSFMDPLRYPLRPRRINGERMPLTQINSHLENLVFSRAMDAEDFFKSSSSYLNKRGTTTTTTTTIEQQTHRTRLTWPNLKTLSLSCQDLHTLDHNNTTVDQLRENALIRAARFLRRMPKIELFELWSTRHKDGTVLIYSPDNEKLRVKLASVWKGNDAHIYTEFRNTESTNTNNTDNTDNTGTDSNSNNNNNNSSSSSNDSQKKALILICQGRPSGGYTSARKMWTSEVHAAWKRVAAAHGHEDRGLEVYFEDLGFFKENSPRPDPGNSLLMLHDKQIIDWNGAEENQLAEKGESGSCVEAI